MLAMQMLIQNLVYDVSQMLLPWDKAGKGTLKVTQQGTGKPWLTVQSVAAVALNEPFSSGYTIKRSVQAVEVADKSLPAGAFPQSHPKTSGCLPLKSLLA